MIYCGDGECDGLALVALLATLAALVIAALLASMFIVSMWYLVSTRLSRRDVPPLPRNAVGIGAGALPVITTVLLARSGVYASDAVLAALIVLPIATASIAMLHARRARRVRADRPTAHPPV
jgi:hypothetical protein